MAPGTGVEEMTDASGLSDGMLLRMADRLALLEQETASNMAAVKAMAEHINELRLSLGALTHEVEELRTGTSNLRQAFEQMRPSLQGLLDLKARFSGAWLVVAALFLVISYLFQPLLAEFYRWRLSRG
jgi:hypothetical protein